MYTLISGSPKMTQSNSLYFLNIVKEKLDKSNIFELKRHRYDDIIDSINTSNTIVLAFPLYVDSPPSLTLKFLDYIIDNKINLDNKLVYIIINCGFREGEQNITAVNIIKRWCEKTNAQYACSILIGAGEIVGKPKYKFISTKALKKLNEFVDIIKNKQIKTDIITTVDILNNKLYCFLANKSWTNNGKRYKLSKKDLMIQ